MSELLLQGVGIAPEAAQARRLKPLDLALHSGEFWTLLGPNGAGKSTLLSLLGGLLPLGKGQLMLKGRPFSRYEMEGRAKLLALMLQQQPLSFPFTVVEVITMGAHPLTLSSTQLNQRLDALLLALDLDALKDRLYPTLSGGERQRVHLARTLMQRGTAPSVILLDEPVASLDPRHQQQALSFLEQLCRDEGHALIVVLHDLNLAARWGNRALLMKLGQVQSAGESEQVLTAEHLSALYDLDIRSCELDGQRLFSSRLASERSDGDAPAP